MNDEDELSIELAQALADGVTAHPIPVIAQDRIRERLLSRVRADACGSDSSTIRVGDDGWVAIAPTLKMRVLHYDRDAAQVSFLLQMAAGAVVPAHSHKMDEECIVVEGEILIGELKLSVGDFHLARKGHSHGDMFSPNGSVLYLRGEVRSFHRAVIESLA